MYIKNKYDRYQVDQQVFKQLVSDIANELNWYIETERTSECFDLSNALHTIRIECDSSPSKGQLANPKIDISCYFSEGEGAGSSFRDLIPDAELLARTTSISCSAGRGATAIAADIKKRLFPDYFFLWNMGIKLRQDKVAREKRLRTLTADLAKVLGTHPHPNSNVGDTIYINPLTIKNDVGVDVSVKDSVRLNAVVRQAWDDNDVDDVKFDMTLPYDLATQFLEWLSTKTVNFFDTWKQNNITFIIRRLDQEASKAGLPPVTQLPPNDFDWVEAFVPSNMDDTHNNRFRLLDQFKKHILPETQTQPEPQIETVEVQPEPQIETVEVQPEPQIETKEDEIKNLFGEGEEADAIRRLSTDQYNCELSRVRDRKKMYFKMEAIARVVERKPDITSQPRYIRTVKILEELEQLHSRFDIDLMVKSLKSQFDSFKSAKVGVNTKARSWQSLAEKLYEK